MATMQERWQNGPRLFVPIGLEALVVNENDRWHGTWSVAPNDYIGRQKLEPYLPHPFSRDDSQIRTGITVRWALPDALTHARHNNENSSPQFPFIPNRWLVLRTDITNPRQPAYRAWILDSDFKDQVTGTTMVTDAQAPGGWTRLGREPRQIWPLPQEQTAQDWQELLDPAEPHLTVLGPGEPGFAAYTAHNDNVLSFCDRLDGLAAEQKATLSYFVAGWYAYKETIDAAGAHLQADPLALANWQNGDEQPEQERFEQLLVRLKWSLGGDLARGDTRDLERAMQAAARVTHAGTGQLDMRLPAQTICHGLLYQVQWTGLHGHTQSGVPAMDVREESPSKTDLPHIAIGNSTNDALAAIMEYMMDRTGAEVDAPDIAKQLMAIENGQIQTFDDLQGEIALDQALHKEWFIGEDGGTRWEVIAARPAPPAAETITPPEADNAIPTQAEVESVAMVSLTETQQHLLNNLNQGQAELDTAASNLRRKQVQLYELWWKWARNRHLSPPKLDPAQLQTALNTAIEQTQLAESGKTSAMENRDDALGILEAALNPDEQQPAARALPRFWRPKDPTVIIYGGQQSELHGQDGRYTIDGTLFCRFSGQTIRSLLQISLLPPENNSDLQRIPTLHALLQNLPDLNAGFPQRAITALILESVLLDPTYAELLSTLGNDSLAAIQTAQKAAQVQVPAGLAVDEQALAAAAGFNGLVPSRHGVRSWSQPWSPLYMSWQITWFPTDRTPAEVVDGSSWMFNPYDGLEYDWAASPLPDHADVLTIYGRSLLARTDLRRLRDNLQALALAGGEHSTATALLNKMRDQLDTADLMSQQLTGLHDRLIMRSAREAYPPPTDYRKITPATPGAPEVEEIVNLAALLQGAPRLAPRPFGDGTGRPHFYPLRAGHFRLNRVWIIDSFGQVFDPIRGRGQSDESFVPLRGPGLATTGGRRRADTQLLQLPPRLVQASRLDFRFINATPAVEEAAENMADPEAGSPVCGWLLPNHLDQSLAVYHADGALLGSFQRTATGEVTWFNEPGAAQLDLADIPQVNAYLAAMLGTLLARPDAAAQFEILLQVIDRTLWGSDPLGDRPQRGIAHLLGRPIAIVRARLGLQLRGDAVHDPRWSATSLTVADNAVTPNTATGGFEAVSFPVQLGDLLVRRDGTLGYFVDTPAAGNGPQTDLTQTFSTFYTVYPETQVGDYVKFDPQFENVHISAAGAPVFLTLLLDPRGSVHARTGILPTKALTLPGKYTDEPLARMSASFRIGPLLTPPETVRLPLPAEVHGSWRWIESSGVNLGDWPSKEVAPISAAPGPDTRNQTIRDGWLTLQGAVPADPDEPAPTA